MATAPRGSLSVVTGGSWPWGPPWVTSPWPDTRSAARAPGDRRSPARNQRIRASLGDTPRLFLLLVPHYRLNDISRERGGGREALLHRFNRVLRDFPGRIEGLAGRSRGHRGHVLAELPGSLDRSLDRTHGGQANVPTDLCGAADGAPHGLLGSLHHVAAHLDHSVDGARDNGSRALGGIGPGFLGASKGPTYGIGHDTQGGRSDLTCVLQRAHQQLGNGAPDGPDDVTGPLDRADHTVLHLLTDVLCHVLLLRRSAWTILAGAWSPYREPVGILLKGSIVPWRRWPCSTNETVSSSRVGEGRRLGWQCRSWLAWQISPV